MSDESFLGGPHIDQGHPNHVALVQFERAQLSEAMGVESMMGQQPVAAGYHTQQPQQGREHYHYQQQQMQQQQQQVMPPAPEFIPPTLPMGPPPRANQWIDVSSILNSLFFIHAFIPSFFLSSLPPSSLIHSQQHQYAQGQQQQVVSHYQEASSSSSSFSSPMPQQFVQPYQYHQNHQNHGHGRSVPVGQMMMSPSNEVCVSGLRLFTTFFSPCRSLLYRQSHYTQASSSSHGPVGRVLSATEQV